MKLKHVVLPFFLLLASAFSRADGLQSTTFLKTGQALTTSLVGTGTTYHHLTWTKTGTVTVCSVRVDSSSDGVTWNVGDIIAAQDCSANGASSNVNFIAAYARVNMTSFTGTGSVTIAYNLYNNIPASGSGLPAGLDTQVQFNDGGVFGGDAGLTWDGTLNSLWTNGPYINVPIADATMSIHTGILTSITETDDGSGRPHAGLTTVSQITDTVYNQSQAVGLFASSNITSNDVGGGPTSAAAYGLQIGATLNGAADFGPSADVPPLVGIYVDSIEAEGSGVVSSAAGIFVAPPVQRGSGTMTRSSGIKISPVSATRITNGAALYILNQGTAANRFAIEVVGGNSDLGPDTTTVGKLAKLTNYNATALTGDGVPYIVANDDKTAQGAALSAVSLIASVPATGIYEVTWVASVTTVGDVSSVLGGGTGFQVIYTSPTDSVAKTSNPTTITAGTSAGNTTATTVGGTVVAYCKVGTALQYSFGYTSVNAGVMQYEIHVKAKALGN